VNTWNHAHALSITESELSNLSRSGRLTVSRDRLVSVPVSDSDSPSIDTVRTEELLALLPSVSPEDEVGILFLLVRFEQGMVPHSSGESARICAIYLAHVLGLYPLAQLSKKILAGRHPELVFRDVLIADAAERRRSMRLHSEAVDTADLLVRALVACPVFCADQALHEACAHAMQVKPSGVLPKADAGFLDRVFDYDRHGPVRRAACAAVCDLGHILVKMVEHNHEALEALRRFVAAAQNSAGLFDLLGSDAFRIWERDHFEGLCDGMVTATASVVFLEWQVKAKKRMAADPRRIAEDVRKANGKIAPLAIEQAVWLIGYYWSNESFEALAFLPSDAPILRSRRGANLATVALGEPPPILEAESVAEEPTDAVAEEQDIGGGDENEAPSNAPNPAADGENGEAPTRDLESPPPSASTAAVDEAPADEDAVLGGAAEKPDGRPEPGRRSGKSGKPGESLADPKTDTESRRTGKKVGPPGPPAVAEVTAPPEKTEPLETGKLFGDASQDSAAPTTGKNGAARPGASSESETDGVDGCPIDAVPTTTDTDSSGAGGAVTPPVGPPTADTCSDAAVDGPTQKTDATKADTAGSKECRDDKEP